MTISIITITIGVIIFISSLMVNPNGVAQQTTKYMGYIWSSLVIIGGLITYTITKGFNRIHDHLYKQNKDDTYNMILEKTMCKKCSKLVTGEYNFCPYCGASA